MLIKITLLRLAPNRNSIDLLVYLLDKVIYINEINKNTCSVNFTPPSPWGGGGSIFEKNKKKF